MTHKTTKELIEASRRERCSFRKRFEYYKSFRLHLRDRPWLEPEKRQLRKEQESAAPCSLSLLSLLDTFNLLKIAGANP
jgi:hypothetical protein